MMHGNEHKDNIRSSIEHGHAIKSGRETQARAQAWLLKNMEFTRNACFLQMDGEYGVVFL